jgi:hypothetical protein
VLPHRHANFNGTGNEPEQPHDRQRWQQHPRRRPGRRYAWIGGLGNDTYIVDNAGDTVIETSTLASEIDTVRSSVNSLWVPT